MTATDFQATENDAAMEEMEKKLVTVVSGGLLGDVGFQIDGMSVPFAKSEVERMRNHK